MKDHTFFKVIVCMKVDSLRARVAAILVSLILFSPDPVRVLGNWGLEVGRADAGDAAALAADWVAFKMERNRIVSSLASSGAIERQKQLLGVSDGVDAATLFDQVQTYWLMKVLPPLQRIAINPAASCAEARFALSTMIGMKRQQQLFGIDESEQITRIHTATQEMASLRCREEALDECVATGRFKQIVDLMMGAERQAQLVGETGDLENWAEDALKQCAIYDLHFVSKTNAGAPPDVKLETVRDGKISIKLEAPAGGLKNAISRPLKDLLKGETAGGNNPFFVSVDCLWPKPLVAVCSPGADSTPIKVGINELELKHREFYVDSINVFDRNVGLMESEITKQRVVGEDKFTFDFEGGKFDLQALIKWEGKIVATLPFRDFGNKFYIAHLKDFGASSAPLTIKGKNIQRGVYPVILQFTYADSWGQGLAAVTDSTDFELIHKPKPKPFPNRSQDPIRKPLRPRPGR